MAELVVFSTIGVRSAAEQLFAQFDKTSGHKLAVTWGTAPMLVKRIEAGDTADVVVLSRAGIDALQKHGKIAAGTDVTLASSGVGIAVKAGAPKPDISTPEALKRTLLAAKSIAYSEPSAGGASGVYFAKLLERMGIAEADEAEDQISAARRLFREPADDRRSRARRAAEAGIAACGRRRSHRSVARRSERGHGVRRGDHGRLQKRRGGKALIKMLQSPDAIAVFRSKGLDTP